MDLLSIILALFEDHIFEYVKQIVDALTIQLGVFVSVSIQMVLWYFLRGFRLKWISSHINYSHCTDC